MNIWHRIQTIDLAEGYTAWICGECHLEVRVRGDRAPSLCPVCQAGAAPLSRDDLRQVRQLLRSQRRAQDDRGAFVVHVQRLSSSVAWSGGYLRRALELAQRAVAGHPLDESERTEASLLLQELRLALAQENP